jgi:O-antigen/teichoic acid export membrane protein
VATAAVLCLPTVGLMLCRVREKAALAAAIQIGHALVTHAVTLWLVVGRGHGAAGVLASAFAGWLLLFAVFAWLFARQTPPRPARRESAETLRYGVPLVPESASGWIIQGSDRFFLIASGGLAATGLYALGGTVASAIAIVVFSAYQAFSPFFFSVAGEPGRAARLVPPILTYYLVVTALAALAVSLLARELVTVLAPAQYAGAAVVVPVLAAAHLFYPLIHAGGCAVLFARRPGLQVIVVVSAALVNLALNAALVPALGAVGAAAATLVTFALHAAAALWLGQRLLPLPYEGRRIAAVLALTMALLALGVGLDAAAAHASLPARAGLLVAFPLILWFGGFVRPSERARLERLLGRWPGRRLSDVS